MNLQQLLQNTRARHAVEDRFLAMQPKLVSSLRAWECKPSTNAWREHGLTFLVDLASILRLKT